jgi:ABC-type dipeptide/oligopeptide/nickel transport system ATPase component
MPPDSTNNTSEAEPVLEIRNLFTHFESDEGVVKAVDGVTFSLDRGKTLGVVGESGCGKSVMVQSILQIVGPTGAIKDGEILLHRDREVVNLAALAVGSQDLRDVRGGEIAIIFQEPMTAFSPVHTIGWQIREAHPSS